MLVRWVKEKGTTPPTRDEVEAMVERANRTNVHEPFIQIAATPDKLPAFLRDALVGGGYHEAWHTEYSRTKKLHVDDIYEPLMALYGLVEDWAPYGQALLTWGNIIEDIRIERLGCKKYPGAPKKMEALQDLILIREDEGRESATHRGLPINDDLNVVMGAFRDLGLGYTTLRQKQVLAAYKDRSLEGWDFVTDGPLTHILDRTIALTTEDDMEHLWLAMEAVAAIVNAGHKGEKPPEEDEGEDEDEPGESPAPECELCGSKNLKFAPSRSVLICKDCGHETPVEIKEGKGKGTPMEIDEDDPGTDDPETKEGDDAGDGDGDPTDGDSGSEKGEDTDSEGDGDAEGKGSSDGDEDTEGDESESGESGEDGDSDSEGAKSGEGDGDGESGSQDGSEGEDEAGKTDTYTDDRGITGKADKGASSTDPTDSETEGGGERQAGGHSDQGDSEAPNLPADFAEKVAEAMGNEQVGSGLLDNNEAMSQAMNNEYDKEDCYEGEQVWRPYCPEYDDVSIVKPRNTEARMRQAKSLRASVKNEIAVIRARLRTKFLSARTPKVVHGLRNGDALSTRRMVQTMTEINLGREPTRPDYKTYHKPDCSLAVAVVIDESGSMCSSRIDAARAMLAIAEPLESLGAPVLCIGSRDGHYVGGGGGYDANGNPRFHRNSGVRIDVFKDWNEPLRRCLPRFACTRAEGSTPLSDGIQYAMQTLSARSERHRIIMVVTDGCPNNPRVVRRQIRLAAAAGITIIGVGIDYGCDAVVDLFPTHVAVHNIKDLPTSMINVLDNIVFPRKAKKVELDGKFGRVKRRGVSV